MKITLFLIGFIIGWILAEILVANASDFFVNDHKTNMSATVATSTFYTCLNQCKQTCYQNTK